MKNFFEKIVKLADDRVDLHIKLDEKNGEQNHSIDVYKKYNKN